LLLALICSTSGSSNSADFQERNITMKLPNLTPNPSRFGKARQMEKGESSTANVNASKKGTGKAGANGSGPSSPAPSSPASSGSSRTEEYLSSSSDSGRDIVGRFDPESYVAHQNEKTEIRGRNAGKALSEIKKDIKASDAHLKREIAKIDKEEAKAVKEKAKTDKAQKKEERKLKKEIAKERAFVIKEQAKARKEQAKMEGKLNKEGKLSLRQEGQGRVRKIAMKEYERDLKAELEMSGATGHAVREYFDSPLQSPRSPGSPVTGDVARPTETGAPADSARFYEEGGPNRLGISRYPDDPVQQGLRDRLLERIDNVPGGFNAEFGDPRRVPVPGDRMDGETGGQRIDRLVDEVHQAEALVEREPEAPHSRTDSAVSRELGRIKQEMDRELKENEDAINEIRASRRQIWEQTLMDGGVARALPVIPGLPASPHPDTEPSSPMTTYSDTSSEHSSSDSYRTVDLEVDLARIRQQNERLNRRLEQFRNQPINQDPIPYPPLPNRPRETSELSPVPKSLIERTLGLIEAEHGRLDRLIARQQRTDEAFAAGDARAAEAFARQRAGRRPNIVTTRVNSIEETIRSQRTAPESASGPNVPRSLQRAEPLSPNVINRPFGDWNDTAGPIQSAPANSAGRQPDATPANPVAWAHEALPSALDANSRVPRTRPISSDEIERASETSSAPASPARPPTPRAQPETTPAERMAWARQALEANPRLGSRNPNPANPPPNQEAPGSQAEDAAELRNRREADLNREGRISLRQQLAITRDEDAAERLHNSRPAVQAGAAAEQIRDIFAIAPGTDMSRTWNFTNTKQTLADVPEGEPLNTFPSVELPRPESSVRETGASSSPGPRLNRSGHTSQPRTEPALGTDSDAGPGRNPSPGNPRSASNTGRWFQDRLQRLTGKKDPGSESQRP
jgi:hypothetical protein